jgi:hypothetical protein
VRRPLHPRSITWSVRFGLRRWLAETRTCTTGCYGVIASDLEPLDKVVRALRAPDRQLHFVYEAGPCGFGIYRISRTFGAAIDEFATVEE